MRRAGIPGRRLNVYLAPRCYVLFCGESVLIAARGTPHSISLLRRMLGATGSRARQDACVASQRVAVLAVMGKIEPFQVGTGWHGEPRARDRR
jgi:hypothetical protein